MPFGGSIVQIPSEWKSVRRMTLDDYSAPVIKKFKRAEFDDLSFVSVGMRWEYENFKINRVSKEKKGVMYIILWVEIVSNIIIIFFFFIFR